MIDSIRVFVSSTFRDMHAERDHLNRFVFPRVRQHCERHGVDFVARDLRWGITREEAEQHLAVDLCLREIDRCRPFFLGLLGDRYGWVPPVDQVPLAVFERARASASAADRALLERCYRVDASVAEPAARLDRAAPDVDPATPRLVALLEHAGSTDAGKSVTELEIDRALDRGGDSVQPRALFYLREGSIDRDPRFPAALVPVFRESDTGTVRRLEALKRRLTDPSRPGRASVYRARFAGLRIDPTYLPDDVSPAERAVLADGVLAPDEWDRLGAPLRSALEAHGTVALDGLEEWGERVLSDLLDAVDSALAREAARRPDPREPHERFIRERTRQFVGREELVDAVVRFAGGDDADATLVVAGAPGSGKSTLLAEAARRCRVEHPNVFVLPHFIGAAPETTVLSGTLASLTLALRARVAGEESIAVEPRALEGQFRSLLEKAAARGPVALFVDAVDRLDPFGESHELHWLPSRPHPGVRVVVSTLPGRCEERLRTRVPARRIVELPPLASDERERIVTAALGRRGKRLSEEQRRLLLDADARPDAALPLYLVVTIEELSLFGDFEGLERRIRALPPRLPALFDQVLERLELDHGRVATERVLTRIATARAGLLESEILDDLAAVDASITAAWWSRLRLALDFYLQRVDDEGERGTTDFYHDQLRAAVYRRYLGMESRSSAPSDACVAAHRALADAFVARAREGDGWRPDAARPLAEMTYHLALGGRLDELAGDLADPAFLEAKLSALEPVRVVEDFDRLLEHSGASTARLDVAGLTWLRDAVRLSGHVLSGDPSQLRSQLWARLLPRRSPLVDALRAAVRDAPSGPWLKPYASELTPAGGALRATMSGMNCVNGVVVSPDGTVALCYDDDNVLWLWNLRTASVWRTVELDRRPWMFRSARHPTRPIVYVAKQGGGVFEVDMEAGAVVRELRTSGRLEDVTITPNGAVLVSTHESGELVRVDLVGDPVSRSFHVGFEDVGAVVAVDADRVVVGVAGRVEEWDIVNETKVRSLADGESDVAELARSIDGRWLAVGRDDGSIVLIDLRDGERSPLDPGFAAGAPKGLAFTPAADRLLAAGPGDDVRVWDTASGEALPSLRGHSMSSNAVTSWGDGTRAASVSKDGTLRIWDLAAAADPRPAFRHAFAVESLTATADVVVTGGRDGEVCAWDTKSGRPLRHWPAHGGGKSGRDWVGAVALSPDACRLISAGADGMIKTWDFASGALIGSRRGFWGEHDRYALGPDGALAVGRRRGGAPSELDVRRTSTGRRIGGVDIGRTAGHVAVVPARREMIVSDLDGGFVVVDFRTGELRWSHAVEGKETRNYVETIAVGPNGRHAVLGFKYGQVAVWDLEERRALGVHALHGDRAWAVAVAPDEPIACSASWDRTLKVWWLATGREIARFSSDDFWAACAFAGAADRVVAADESGAVHFLRLEGRPSLG